MVLLESWTIVLAQNNRARALYESEGFQVVDIFEATNAGYPCTCMELSLQPKKPEKTSIMLSEDSIQKC